MSAAVVSRDSRCFEPFFDPIDGVLSLPASATAADIAARVNEGSWRFPLLLDDCAPLVQQIAASTHAPASSRFGPYCDNVLGMNWQLPDGRILRIGERVVKTTTGYDLFRFLLHSGGRYGQPIDFVLRLRPECGHSGKVHLEGPADAVRNSVPHLLHSSWMHWLDAIDVIADRGRYQLRISVNSPAAEWPLFKGYFGQFATSQGLDLKVLDGTALPLDGCPDFVFKTSPERLLDLVEDVGQTSGIRSVAMCYCGVLLGYVQDQANVGSTVDVLGKQFADSLHAHGGDWHSRHLTPPISMSTEANWSAILQREGQLS